MRWGLIALALGGFGIGLTEFGIVGLLPEIADDFGVREDTAGLLVSGYALSVAVGALGLTVAVRRFSRKPVLLALMCLFILGNLLSALAPTFAVMLLARVIAALCHGAFFSIGAVVASQLVEKSRAAQAIALMFAGLTVANVLGVPVGTFLGQLAGWRSTFWAISVVGVVAMIGIAVLVHPRVDEQSPVGLSAELRVVLRGQVLASALVSVGAFGGLVGAFTYSAFTLTHVSGFATASLPWLLLLFGVGSFIGNLLGGRAADRGVDRSLAVTLATMSILFVAFALLAEVKAAVVVLMLLLGIVGFASAPALQLRVMRFAGDAPTLGSGVNIAALNVGNALGAWVCGLALTASSAYVAPLWVGAVFASAALAALGAARGMVALNDAAPKQSSKQS
ncbi:MFS transporter [Kribbella sp. NPDC051137]|uniref:MFS transporter n=1 Tax=Kribbella sp. NPDC051137 TaxID=3155045 RepID=UPI003423BE80